MSLKVYGVTERIFGEKIVNKIFQQQLNESSEFLQSLPWEDKSFYANYLAQTYYFVCHSTRLLGRSLSYFQVDREKLYKRFKDHISEEDSHEKIALSDLKKLGFNIKDYPELSVTRAFYESQYYKIEQSFGVGLLGYILYLEAIAIKGFPSIIESLYETYGKGSCQFLKVHVEEDPEHVNKAIEEIEVLSDKEKSQIWQNFIQTAEIYHSILSEVQKSCKNSMVFQRAS